MNSIVQTYPGFQSLPTGIQQMLMVSELCFLIEARQTLADVVLKKTSRGESWKPQVIRIIERQFYGTCFAWGKQNQVIPTLTV
jgi:hypothetical protein